MRQTLTPRQWFDRNVHKNNLRNNVISSMAESIRFDNIEDDTYIALVQTIVGSGYGHYIPLYVLEYFEYDDLLEEDEYRDNYEYQDEVINEIDSFAIELEKCINDNLDIDITVGLGYWDADGSWGLMAYLDRNQYEEYKYDLYLEISEKVD